MQAVILDLGTSEIPSYPCTWQCTHRKENLPLTDFKQASDCWLSYLVVKGISSARRWRLRCGQRRERSSRLPRLCQTSNPASLCLWLLGDLHSCPCSSDAACKNQSSTMYSGQYTKALWRQVYSKGQLSLIDKGGWIKSLLYCSHFGQAVFLASIHIAQGCSVAHMQLWG